MIREAACHCGAASLRCEGEPAKVSLCHCRDCQRRTGSLFSVAAFFPRELVAVTGIALRQFRRGSASGFDVTFHFCPECGTNLMWEAARLPHVVGVAAGAFADPTFACPEQQVWCEERHHWLILPGAIPAYARNPVRPAAPD